MLLPYVGQAQIPVSQVGFLGTYSAKTSEKDTILNEMVQVFIKLDLNGDSTFTFSKKSEKGNCDSNRAGFWKPGNGTIILDFIQEEPLVLNINQGQNYLSLINKSENLYFLKQQKMIQERVPGEYRPARKRAKEQKCPTF